MVPIVILMIWIGLYPKPYLRSMEASVGHWLNHVQQASVQRDASARGVWPSVVQPSATPVADAAGKED
jgi:NADH-quinone oxidoreductase subunit M